MVNFSIKNTFYLLFGAALLLGCEGALEGRMVIPHFTALCETSACAEHSGSRPLMVYLTRSSCGHEFYDGEVITGTGQVSCSSGDCQGQVNSWLQNGRAVADMKKDIYSVCAYIDLQQSLPDLEVPGNSVYLRERESFDGKDTSYQLAPWSDL